MVVTQAIVMLIVSVSLGAAGQLCLKHGVNLLGENVPPLQIIKGIFTPYVLGGFLCYGLSSLIYLWVLSKLSLSFVMVMVASWALLGEALPPLRIAGAALILLGVLTVAASYQGDRSADVEPTVPSIEQPQ